MGNEQPLSERELEILRMVATGASNKAIAQTLAISPNTVKVHLRNIFAKIGVESRMEATLYALRVGLVPSPAAAEKHPSPSDEPTAKNTLRPQAFIYIAAALLVVAFLAISLAISGNRPEQNPAAAATPSAVPARWQVQTDLPEPRAGMAATAYENAIYLIGGETPQGVSSTVLILPYDSREWRTQAPKPTAVRYIQAVLFGEKIYIPGGEMEDGQVTNRMEVYNPRLNRWSEGVPLPKPVCRYALAVLEGRLYLFGGWDGKQYHHEVYIFDPQKYVWLSGAPLPGGRADAGAVAMETKIMIVGGTDGTRSLSECLFYRPDRDNPSESPWEACPALPSGRSAMGLTKLAGSVYLVGGSASAEKNMNLTSLFYNERSHRWQIFESPPQDAGSYPALLSIENSLQLMGGRLSTGLSASHQSYLAIFTSLFPIIQ